MELDIESANHLKIKKLDNREYQITTTGGDPFIYTKPFKSDYDPKKEYIFSFEYFSLKGIEGIQLFYGPPVSEKHSAHGPEVLSSEGWTSYSLNIKRCQNRRSWRKGYTQFRIDFGRKSGRSIQLRNIQLRAPNAHEKKLEMEAKEEFAKKMLFDVKLQDILEFQYDSIIEAGSS